MAIDYSKLKEGDIFYTYDRRSPIARIIKYVETGGKDVIAPAHCGVITYVDEELTSIAIVDAMLGKGVTEGFLCQYDKSYIDVWISRIKGPADIPRGIDWVMTQVGRPYSKGQLFGILMLASLRWVNSLMKRHVLLRKLLEKKEKFICSELTERFARACGRELKDGDPDFITPYDEFRSVEQDFIWQSNGTK